MKYLVEQGADVNAKSVQRGFVSWTPLHFVAQGRSVEELQYLISHGADVFAKDDDGKTPLDVAASEERKRILLMTIWARAI